MNQKGLWKIIGAVAVINLISRLLGFFREVIIGYHFGTSTSADSIINAYTIPNFIYIVVGGAVTTAFISVYNKTDSFRVQQKVKDVIFTYTFVVLTLISAIFFVFSESVIKLIFKGLNKEETILTARLFQIMGPSTFFLVFSMFFSGILNVKGKFHLTSMAPLINNLLFIIVALSMFPFLKEQSYAWGVFFGAIAMVLMLLVGLRKEEELPFRFCFSMKDKEYIFRFSKIFFPILFGGATLQFYFLIHRVFASSLESGYVASLNYSSKLVQLPQAILMTAVTTVIYPLITKKVGEGDSRGLEKIYREGVRYLIFLMIPATIFIYLYAENIIKIIFEYGVFDEKSSYITSNLLKILVLGMFAHAANLYVTRFFYAMEKAFLPVVSGVIAVFGINVLIIVLFLNLYGATAIAWGTIIGAYFQLLVLIIGTKYILKLSLGKFVDYVKFILLFFCLFVIGLFVKVNLFLTTINLLQLVFGFLIVVVSFVMLSLLFQIDEINKLLYFGRKRK